MFTLSSVSGTSAASVRTLTSVKHAKKGDLMNILSSKFRDLRMPPLQSALLSTKKRRNKSKLKPLAGRRLKRRASLATLDSEISADKELSQIVLVSTEAANSGRMLLITSCTWLISTWTSSKLEPKRKRPKKDMAEEAAAVEDGLKREQSLSKCKKKFLKASLVKSSWPRWRFRTRPSGLGRVGAI